MKKAGSTTSRALGACLDRLHFAAQAAGLGFWEWDVARRRLTSDEHTATLFRSHPVPRRRGARVSLAQAFTGIVHGDDLQAFCDAMLASARPDGPATPHRCRMCRVDGGVRHMDVQFKVTRNAKGAASKILALTIDVTERVEQEEMYRQRSAAERALVERLSVATQAAGIYVWEFDYRTQQIRWDENRLTTAAGRRHVGMELGSELFKYVHPEDLGIGAASMKAALERGEPDASFRYRLQLPDGSIRHIQAYARTFVDEEGKPLRSVGVSWDVTDEVAAAEEAAARVLRESQLQTRLSVASHAAGMNCWEFSYVLDKFTWFDRLPVEMDVDVEKIGVDAAAELLNASLIPEDAERLRQETLEALAAGQKTMTGRIRRRTADGRIRHIEVYQRFFFDQDGKPTHAVGASRDITEQVEAAERLQHQAEELEDAHRRLERASLSILEGHWEIDLITRKHWVSSNYYKLLGYEPGEIDLSDTEKLEKNVHPDDLEWSKAEAQKHIETNCNYDIELRVRVKSGEYRWFRVRGNAERDEHGNAIRLSGAIHDIQKQRMAEEALKVARERFERAIRGTQDGLWEWDVQTRMLWVSPRYEEILGYEEGELLRTQKAADAVIHPDDLPAWRAAQEAHSKEGVPFDIEVRMRTRQGDYRWIRARGQADRDESGKPLRVSGSIQDVTEAREARDALIRASEAAQAANRAKSAFLANVSHEIRTPMNGIIGMTSLLLDTKLDGPQREYAETIRASADSLLRVINDILDFSKIEAGKLDIDAIEMDLHGNVEDIGSIMGFQAAAKGLEFIVHVHPDVPERVLGDPQRIRQCLINLVGNAIKFTRSGEIVAEVFRVGVRDGAVLTRFQVRDTGIGIAADTMKTLFQPFVQADASTTRHFGGTGLGLSIVRRLVEMMGGQVGVESEPGRGSTFWFELPMQPVDTASFSTALPPERNGKRVLVVDDNRASRRMLKVQLESAGFEVTLATDGAKALDVLRAAATREPFHAVVTDLQMPQMDGPTLAERIQSDPHLAGTQVVLLTSMDHQGDQRNFADKGLHGFAPKPVRPRELLKCLDKLLAENAPGPNQAASAPQTAPDGDGSRAPEARFRGRVLLVEDNPVNQKVAIKFLERLGCLVAVADNGADAIRAWENNDFDLVLMDVQMPVMDGYTATAHIRSREGSRRRTPIVALTANAMTGQLERCLEAGMDGLLTKPLDNGQLQETLERYGLSEQQEESVFPEASPPDAANGALPLDFGRLLDATGQDHEFACDLAQSYITNCRALLAEIRAGQNRDDRPQIARAAHQLKGSSANVCAAPLRELSSRLEAQAATLSASELEQAIANVAHEIDRVERMVRSLPASGSAAAVS